MTNPTKPWKIPCSSWAKKRCEETRDKPCKNKKQSLTILYGTRRAFFLGILLFWLGNWLTFCSCSQLRSDRPSMFQGTGSGTSTWTWDTHGVVGTFAAKKTTGLFTAIHSEPASRESRIDIKILKPLEIVFFPFNPGEQWVLNSPTTSKPNLGGCSLLQLPVYHSLVRLRLFSFQFSIAAILPVSMAQIPTIWSAK